MNFFNMPMADIKKTVEALDETRWAEAADFLKDDQRKGARNIGKALERKLANMALERSRINEMKKIEERYRDDGIEIIAGIDEVGRGPLAGPVVSCAIILPPECDLLHINDSKKISEEKRKYLFEQLKKKAVSLSVGVVSPETIDDVNILNATKKSMRLALEQLSVKPQMVLIDAVALEELDIRQMSIIKGDEKCYSIAAASIVAKVVRDDIMADLHEKYPEYNFLSNKGYGTKDHIEAIKIYGLSPIHRRSFCKNFI